MSLRSEMIAAVGEEYVKDDVGGERAGLFITPGSAAEVAEVIRRANALRVAVHPVGAGGKTEAAHRDLTERERVFVSTRRLDQVLPLDEQSLLVHAQVGITGLDLARILAPRGLSIGDYPPVVLTSSLGGIIAVRTPGKSSARHGFFEEAVAGVSAGRADGRTVHTRVAPRRSTGPDLSRALCGSEGTIGFITSADRGSTRSRRRGTSRRTCCLRSRRRSAPCTSRCARRPRRRASGSTTRSRRAVTSMASSSNPAKR